MVRDFSESAKEELMALVERVEPEKICGLTDLTGDQWYSFEEWIGVLALRSDLSNVNLYHKKIIDKNNTTLEQLEKIFDEVYLVESEYHKVLQNMIETCRAFNQLLAGLNDIIMQDAGVRFTVSEINTRICVLFADYQELFDTYVCWDEALKKLSDGCRERGVLTDADKEEYIVLFELYYAEWKQKLGILLQDLPEDQLREIKYIAYAAEEPYRSIYLSELESYRTGNLSGDDTGYFSPGSNTIHVNLPEEEDNPRGAYTTFFHESGHAIDFNYNDDGDYYSITYRSAEGKRLQEVIYDDVRNDVSETIARYTSDEETQEILLKYIMGAGSVSEESLTTGQKKLLEHIQNYYKKEMKGAVNESCSDVYGGVTNNIISGSYGHWSGSYWYRPDGSATYAQSKELWAEYYSYCMTGNEDAMERLREYFPTAAEFLDDMATSMVS